MSTYAGVAPPAVREVAVEHPLVGRESELARLSHLLTGEGGAALLLRGDPGTGKSTLLAAAADEAARRGVGVLGCAGVEGQAPLAYAALHEALHPHLHRLAALPPRQAAALRTVFGLVEDVAADPLLIALGALSVLEDAAHEQPLLVLVDDAQWVDRPSLEVFGFVSRRLRGLPVVLLAAGRPTGSDALESFGMPAVTLDSLPRREAERLLARADADLDDEVRARVLTEAQGNPLALVELPRALRATASTTPLPPLGRLPLTMRLTRAFGAQLDTLPSACRELLLLLAVNDESSVAELSQVATHVGGTVADLAPAEQADVVRVVGERLHFRHPLLRSAVYGAASLADRAAAHRAVAESLPPGSARAAWHRAAASMGRDEAVAADLEAAAAAHAERGALAAALPALEAAGRLSPAADERARRLAAAARTALQAGHRRAAGRLVAEAGALTTDPVVVADLSVTEYLLRVSVDTPGRSTAALLDVAAGVAGREQEATVLLCAAMDCFTHRVDPAVRARVERALLALDLHPADPRRVMALAVVAPGTHGPALRPVLAALVERVDSLGLGPALSGLGGAAEALQMVPLADRCYAAATDSARRAGAVTEVCMGLIRSAAVRVTLGRLTEALTASEEALRLAEEMGLPVAASGAAAVSARVHAWRGDVAALQGSRATARAHANGPWRPHVAADAAWALGVAALAERRHRDAAEALLDMRVHPTFAVLAVADLAEAVAHLPAGSAAGAALSELILAADAGDSAHLRALVLRARALRAAGDDAGDDAGEDSAELFEASLAVPAGETSALEHARTRLLYGQWLRRQRRVLAAREQLAGAAHAFEAEGARPWAERARAELRAAGVSLPTAARPRTSDLTPQELQIAALAAEGLSNKDIADQVYLSHRTVGAHLHRTFTKLGITGRGELRALLATSV